MVVSCGTPDLSSPPQSSDDAHHIIWLVKRRAYELVFTTPKSLGPLSYRMMEYVQSERQKLSTSQPARGGESPMP